MARATPKKLSGRNGGGKSAVKSDHGLGRQMATNAGRAAELLKAMSNPQRLRILCLLLEREMAVSDINARIEALSQSALSQHLAVLREQGLVQTRREAQTVYYTLAPGPAGVILHALHGIYCAGAATRRSRR